MRRNRGMTLIELMITLALLAMLLMLGLPALSITIQNFRVRTMAETIVSGLQTARTEAVRRNASVRFQLVDALNADCNLSSAGPHWVVSRNDPTAACDQAEVEALAEPNVLEQPQILMKRSAGEGTANVALAATSGGAPATSVLFTALGRTAAGAVDSIEVTNPGGGTCEHAGGQIRCLRILIGRGGQVRMCDPSPNIDASDSRHCP